MEAPSNPEDTHREDVKRGAEKRRTSVFSSADVILRFAQLVLSLSGFIAMESMTTCSALSGAFGFSGFVSLLTINTVVFICVINICGLHHLCPLINFPLTLLFHDSALSLVSLMVSAIFAFSVETCGTSYNTDIVLSVLSAVGVLLFLLSAFVDYNLMKKELSPLPEATKSEAN